LGKKKLLYTKRLIETGETIQRPTNKEEEDKTMIYKAQHRHRATRFPLKTGGELVCSGRVLMFQKELISIFPL
jgi:hypothetical protein